MRITSTADVQLPDLELLVNDLDPACKAEVDDSQVFQLSADPPSWVCLLADADWWLKGMAAYAALYVAELVREAAKDTWRHRTKIARAAVENTEDVVNKVAEAVAALRSRLSSKTDVSIGLPIPDDYFATRLQLEGADPGLLAAQVALFVYHLPALTEFITEKGLTDETVGTGIFLSLRDDGALLVRWHDSDTLQIQEHAIALQRK